jgi:hypothetical protein
MIFLRLFVFIAERFVYFSISNCQLLALSNFTVSLDILLVSKHRFQLGSCLVDCCMWSTILSRVSLVTRQITCDLTLDLLGIRQAELQFIYNTFNLTVIITLSNSEQ